MATGDSFDETLTRIRAALSARAPRKLTLEGLRPAAVLVPVLRRPQGPTVLFTLRSQSLSEHRGEVSFPGGRLEAGEDAPSGALREANEEVGLETRAVELLGTLDDYPSVTSYVVTPVVGAVANPPDRFARDEAEVRESFEVPLERLLDPRLLRTAWRDLSKLPLSSAVLRAPPNEDHDPSTGRHRLYFFDASGPERPIWGLTARILKELLDRAFDFSGARGGGGD